MKSQPQEESMMMAEGKRPVVHIVGHYVPTASAGLEYLAEIDLFRQIFFNSNIRNGAETSFLMGHRNDPRNLTEKYISGKVRKGDIMVLLNPAGDCRKFGFRHSFGGLVTKVRAIIGWNRIVVAFQSDELRTVMSNCTRNAQWEIDYSPSYTWVNGDAQQLVPEPVPEQAIQIVARIIKGEKPDVYAFAPVD